LNHDVSATPAPQDLAGRTQPLARSLRHSGLAEAPAAAAMLDRSGVQLIVKAQAHKASALLLAYARRRLVLASFHSQYAARLRRAIGELIANLRPVGTLPVDILDVHFRRHRCFLLFRLGADGPVLGCLPYAGRHPLQ
jgi:uncharacterized protein with von Willebrand factor type A (vWA) domain